MSLSRYIFARILFSSSVASACFSDIITVLCVDKNCSQIFIVFFQLSYGCQMKVAINDTM